MAKVEELYAFVFNVTEEEEGIVTFKSHEMMFPLVAGDNKQAAILMPIAQGFAKQLKRDIKLVKFQRSEDLETISSK